MQKLLIQLILLSAFISGCSQKKNIRLSTNVAGSQWHKNGVLIADAMKKYGWEVDVLSGAEYALNPTKNVQNGIVDFAIIENSKTIDQSGIRAIAPLNQEAMLVFYKPDQKEYTSLKNLLADKTVLLPSNNEEAQGLILEIFNTLDIDASSFKRYTLDLENLDLLTDSWKSELDNFEVMISFTQLNNVLSKEILNLGWKILPIGDFNNLGKGSLIDALCIRYPWAFPLILPVNVLGQKQPEPVYTIGLRSLLIANKDLNEDLVYDFLKDFYASVPTMSQSDVSFALITEDYNVGSISYPLHDGTIRYFDRDKPMFIERYAELIALMVTLSVLFVGIANRYIKWMHQKKKDRIDVYYDMILAATSLAELEKIRLKAIQQMQDENLLADETFVIFLQLYEQRKDEL